MSSARRKIFLVPAGIAVILVMALVACSNPTSNDDSGGAGTTPDSVAIAGTWYCDVAEHTYTDDTAHIYFLSDSVLDLGVASIEWYDNDLAEMVVLFGTNASTTAISVAEQYMKVSWSPVSPDAAVGSPVAITYHEPAIDLETARAATADDAIGSDQMIRTDTAIQKLDFVPNQTVSLGTGGYPGNLTWNPDESLFYLNSGATYEVGSGTAAFYTFDADFAPQGMWVDTGSDQIGGHAVAFNSTGGAAMGVNDPVPIGSGEGPIPTYASGFYRWADPAAAAPGTTIGAAGELDALTDKNTRRVAYDANDNLFVVSKDLEITRYDADDDSTTSYTVVPGTDFAHNTYTMIGITAVRTDGAGNVYVSIDLNGEPPDDPDNPTANGYDAVLQLDNALTGVTRTWDGSDGTVWRFNRPVDIAFDANDRMYVLMQSVHCIAVYDVETGRMVGYTESSDGSSVAGGLNSPLSIEIVGNSLYVSDTDNARVSVFRTIQ